MVIHAVYRKLPHGQKVRFGIEGPVAEVHHSLEKNEIDITRAMRIASALKGIASPNDRIEMVDMTDGHAAKALDPHRRDRMTVEVLLKKAPAYVPPSFTPMEAFLPLPEQHFVIDPRQYNRLEGDHGTVVHIPAHALQLANGSVPERMNVSMVEVYDKGDFIRAGLHTASDGRMLRSGGSVRLTADAGGRAAQVAPGKELDLEFPHSGNEPASNMETFNGRVDRNGNFDWVRRGDRVERTMSVREEFFINGQEVSKQEYLAKQQEWENRKAAREREEQIAEQVERNEEAVDAYLLQTDELGWINCDEFYDVENTVDVIVLADTLHRPSVRMVFDEMKSVLAGEPDARTGTVIFRSVPMDAPVRIIGYSVMDGVPYMDERVLRTSGSAPIELNLQASSKDKVQFALAELGQ